MCVSDATAYNFFKHRQLCMYRHCRYNYILLPSWRRLLRYILSPYYMSTRLCVHVFVDYMCVCAHVCASPCVLVCMCMSVCVLNIIYVLWCICVCECMCVCVCVILCMCACLSVCPQTLLSNHPSSPPHHVSCLEVTSSGWASTRAVLNMELFTLYEKSIVWTLLQYTYMCRLRHRAHERMSSGCVPSCVMMSCWTGNTLITVTYMCCMLHKSIACWLPPPRLGHYY